MNFETQYLAATKAFDAKAYVDATNTYLDLLETAKDRILEILDNSAAARLVHSEMAIQSGLQKTLIRRIQGDDVITIDLALFTKNLPLCITYGPSTCSFLKNWKDASPTFQANMKTAIERYKHLCETKLNGMPCPDVVPGDVYAAMWVATDLIDFERYLPDTADGYVNLGCGCGLFDSTYLKGSRSNIQARLIDIDPSAKSTVEQLILENDLSSAVFLDHYSGEMETPSLVVSVRSCSYLYDADTYDVLFRKMKPGSCALLDVGNDREAKTTAYFESLGATAHHHERLNDTSVQLIKYVF
ncbi:MAG: hypothetical protein RJS98_13385 [Rhodospirillaceae bacterium]